MSTVNYADCQGQTCAYVGICSCFYWSVACQRNLKVACITVSVIDALLADRTFREGGFFFCVRTCDCVYVCVYTQVLVGMYFLSKFVVVAIHVF